MIMAERYQCNLSPELLKKAVAELNEPEDNDKRLEAIDKLRTRFQTEVQDLELIRTDDTFLLRFLRVRKFNEDKALATLINYHKQRKEWREVFDKVDNPESVEKLLTVGAIMPLEGRARDDTFVILGRPGLGYDHGDDITMFLALIVLTIEKLLENEEMQIRGVTIIEDMAQFRLALAVQMATYGRQFLSVVQDAMPVRVKSLNMVNEGTVFDVIYSVVSHFMKDKLKNRLKIHGTNFATLHEVVDAAQLPTFLGGKGPDLRPECWKRKMLSTIGMGEDTAL